MSRAENELVNSGNSMQTTERVSDEGKTSDSSLIPHPASLKNAWLVLAMLSVGVVLAALDLTVVVAILTTMMTDLGVDISDIDLAAWIVSAYLLAYTVTMPLMGRVSDIFGRRSVFITALGIFVIGSLVGALSTSLPMMIVARVLQALGGGAMVPVAMAVVGDLFPTSKRGLALGIIGAADTAGWIIGPLYGSLMLKAFNWHSVFWVNIPLGLLSAILIFFALKPQKRVTSEGEVVPVKKHSWRELDLLGFLFLAAALTCLTLALGGGKETQALSGNVGGFSDLETHPLKDLQTPLLIAAAVTFVIFVVVELLVKTPLINLRTFLRSTYTAANITNFIIGSVLIVAMVGIALFVNFTDNSKAAADIAFHSGLALVPLTFGMAIGAVAGGWLSDRLSYMPVTVVGLLLILIGFAGMTFWQPTYVIPNDLPQLLPAPGVAGLGFGLVIAPVGSAVIDWAERADIGTAAALVLILRLVGMTVGLSVLVPWALNRYKAIAPELNFSTVTRAATVKPLAQVLTEMFLAAAGLTAIALLPALFLRRRKAVTEAEKVEAAARREVGRLL